MLSNWDLNPSAPLADLPALINADSIPFIILSISSEALLNFISNSIFLEVFSAWVTAWSNFSISLVTLLILLASRLSVIEPSDFLISFDISCIFLNSLISTKFLSLLSRLFILFSKLSYSLLTFLRDLSRFSIFFTSDWLIKAWPRLPVCPPNEFIILLVFSNSLLSCLTLESSVSTEIFFSNSLLYFNTTFNTSSIFLIPVSPRRIFISLDNSFWIALNSELSLLTSTLAKSLVFAINLSIPLVSIFLADITSLTACSILLKSGIWILSNDSLIAVSATDVLNPEVDFWRFSISFLILVKAETSTFLLDNISFNFASSSSALLIPWSNCSANPLPILEVNLLTSYPLVAFCIVVLYSLILSFTLSTSLAILSLIPSNALSLKVVAVFNVFSSNPLSNLANAPLSALSWLWYFLASASSVVLLALLDKLSISLIYFLYWAKSPVIFPKSFEAVTFAILSNKPATPLEANAGSSTAVSIYFLSLFLNDFTTLVSSPFANNADSKPFIFTLALLASISKSAFNLRCKSVAFALFTLEANFSTAPVILETSTAVSVPKFKLVNLSLRFSACLSNELNTLFSSFPFCFNPLTVSTSFLYSFWASLTFLVNLAILECSFSIASISLETWLLPINPLDNWLCNSPILLILLSIPLTLCPSFSSSFLNSFKSAIASLHLIFILVFLNLSKLDLFSLSSAFNLAKPPVSTLSLDSILLSLLCILLVLSIKPSYSCLAFSPAWETNLSNPTSLFIPCNSFL